LIKEISVATILAVDGMEALNMAKKQKFDWVITDANMPNMDGTWFVKEFRALNSPLYCY